MMNVWPNWQPIGTFALTKEANSQQEIYQGTGTAWHIKNFLDDNINWWKISPEGILPTQPNENSVVYTYFLLFGCEALYEL